MRRGWWWVPVGVLAAVASVATGAAADASVEKGLVLSPVDPNRVVRVE